MSESKVYLGDAVYVEIEHGMIKLTTEDGIRATNTIYLEAETFKNLIKWAKLLKLVGVTQ